MNRLELAQEIYDKINLFRGSVLIKDHRVMAQVYNTGIIFSVWKNEELYNGSLQFRPDMSIVHEQHGYDGSIDEARAALKEFLEGEI